MSTTASSQPIVWRNSTLGWLALTAAAAVLAVMNYDGLKGVLDNWLHKEEYSHGLLIPVIVAFLIWQRKDELEQQPFRGSWLGVVVVLLALVLFFVGRLTQIYIVNNYAFLVALSGTLLAYMGLRAFGKVWVPLLILFLSIPLPNFLYNNLSAQLQLLSSELGVAIMRLWGVSVFLEGNVIDLGSYKLQVVEACSGLRYLFPLMTLGFIAAYFFKEPFWKRVVVFLSSIPIAVLMNSLRIGAIGIMVDRWGQEMAEGFLHQFEGWAIFMSCTAVLLLEMWALARIGPNRKHLREAFGIEFPQPSPAGAQVQRRGVPKQISVVAGLLILAAALSLDFSRRNMSFLRGLTSPNSRCR